MTPRKRPEDKKKVGRHKEKPGDKVDLGLVTRLAEQGFTDAQIAELIGFSEQTIERYKKDPEFLLALKKGKETPDGKVIQSLYKRAIGYDYEETTIEGTPTTGLDGKVSGMTPTNVKKIKKHMAPDVGAMCFWLKNRQPRDWRDRHELVGDPTQPMRFIVRYESERRVPKT
jgi:hypothetical protein